MRAALRPLRTLAACSFLLLTGCGEEAPAPKVGSQPTPTAVAPLEPVPNAVSKARPSPANAPKTAGDSSSPPAPAAWFAGRMRPLAPWIGELRKRIDPAADGWPTEVAAQAIEARLQPALEAWLKLGDAQKLRELCAEDFQGASGLVPAKTQARFDDHEIQVLDAPDEALARAASAEFQRELEAWRATYSAVAYVEVSVDEIERTSETSARTSVRVRVVGGETSASEGRVQDALHWSADWSTDARGANPRLRSLSSVGHRRVRDSGRALADVTAAVFGGNECFAEEILRGNDDDHLRQDRLCSQPLLGMHGLAIGDVDGDGLEDVYVPQPGGVRNRLFVHQADHSARDIASEARVDFLDNCNSALLCDFDNDGDLDLAVGSGPHVFLCWNDGKGRFPKGQVLQAKDEPEITTLAAADPDLDGDLDLFCCRYVSGGMIGAAPAPYHDAHNGATNLFWRNEGDGKFVECAKELGLEAGDPRFTLAASWHDFDGDGDDDLFLVNDFGRKQLLRNDRGSFVDVAKALRVDDQAAGMGIDIGDVDGDGREDVYLTNMHTDAGLRIARQPQFLPAHPELRPDYVHHARGNTLLRAKADGTYEDVTDASGCGPAGWGWGARFFDLQNDGQLDIYAPCGFVTGTQPGDLASFFWRCVIARTSMSAPPEPEYVNAWSALRHFTTFEGGTYNGRERNRLFLNLGGTRFAEIGGALDVDFADDGRVCAPLDWDGDGKLDLLLRNRMGPRLRLLHNQHSHTGRWIAFDLAGTRCNRDAIGAVVSFEAGGRRWSQEVHSQAGYMCGASRRLFFGLADNDHVEKLEVRWPGGERESFGRAEVGLTGQRYKLVQGAGIAQPATIPARAANVLESRSTAAPLAHVHRPRERIVLLDRLPMGALELPSATNDAPRLDSLAGKPALVCLVDAGDPLCLRIVDELARARAELERSGTRVVLVAQGTPEQQSALRARASSMRTDLRACDASFLEGVQVFLIDVLGPFEKLPLPLALVLDPVAQLVALHCGPIDVAWLARDCAALKQATPAPRDTREIHPGRMISTPARDLGALAQVFDLLGRAELADFCRQKLKERAPR